MNRELIREQTMQLIYQMDISGDFDYTHLRLMDENSELLKEASAVKTLEFLRDNIRIIDETIARNTTKWNADRIAKTDRAILRTAVTEMLYIDSIPVSVSINEAVELAKKFGDERSYAFVNSVLGGIAKEK